MYTIWTLQNGCIANKYNTKVNVLKKYNQFRKKADLKFLPYIKASLQTEHEFLTHLEQQINNYHLRRSSKKKSTLVLEHEASLINVNYKTEKKTIVELYLFFDTHTSLLHKVILEVLIPQSRSSVLSTHMTICRKIGFSKITIENES